MDFVIYALKYFAAPATVIAAVTWLAKEIILQTLKTQSALEIEKSRHEMQKNLDRLRYQLHRDIEDFKTRFSYLQEKRFEPLLKLYYSVSELCSKASYIHTTIKFFADEEISDHIEELYELEQKAKQDYYNALLFLPKNIADNSSNIIKEIGDAEQSYYVELNGGSGDSAVAQKILQDKLTINYDFELENLSNEIRFLLGVENEEQIK